MAKQLYWLSDGEWGGWNRCCRAADAVRIRSTTIVISGILYLLRSRWSLRGGRTTTLHAL